MSATRTPDIHGNTIAEEGCTRCYCGCKYWEHDRCIDCNTHVTELRLCENPECPEAGYCGTICAQNF